MCVCVCHTRLTIGQRGNISCMWLGTMGSQGEQKHAVDWEKPFMSSGCDKTLHCCYSIHRNLWGNYFLHFFFVCLQGLWGQLAAASVCWFLQSLKGRDWILNPWQLKPTKTVAFPRTVSSHRDSGIYWTTPSHLHYCTCVEFCSFLRSWYIVSLITIQRFKTHERQIPSLPVSILFTKADSTSSDSTENETEKNFKFRDCSD